MTVTPSPPETLREALAGRYQLLREVGRGGMATVYLANDVKHNRQVAVKVLKPDLAASLGADRFLREIEIAAQLNHPHILPLLDSADLDGALLYVMPYVDGESVRGLMDREGVLRFEKALAIASEVARALTYAHRRGVVHRDIKPENILLSDGHAVVADFGIAKAISSLGGRALTRTGFPIGTPGYMSPEQAAGITDLDERSDVFSLGCVVYEMLIGDTPSFWLSEEAVRLERFTDAPTNHRTRFDDLPRGVEQALVRALALRPDDRLASPADFIAALGERPPKGPRRRYSDTEVGAIVKQAAEDEARDTEGGMTMGGVQALGAEVGIEPAKVAKAAQALELRMPGTASSLLGGPLSYHFRDDYVGSVEPSEQMELINVIREAMGQQGQATEVMGSLEWSSQGTEQVTVTITPRKDDIGVTMIADRRIPAWSTYGLPLFVGMFTALIISHELRTNPLGTLVIFGTAVAASLAVARTVFVTTGKALKRKLDRVRAEVGRYLERGAGS